MISRFASHPTTNLSPGGFTSSICHLSLHPSISRSGANIQGQAIWRSSIWEKALRNTGRRGVNEARQGRWLVKSLCLKPREAIEAQIDK